MLTRLNRGLHSILSHAGTRLYATACVVVADVALARLTYSNAGHPKPFHDRRSDEQMVVLDGGKGPALGLFEEARYTTAHADLTPGDGLILFTDGLFEVEDPSGTLYSQQDLLVAARRHGARPMTERLDALLAEVRTYTARSAFDDDVCLIGMEVAARGNGSVAAPAAGSNGGES